MTTFQPEQYQRTLSYDTCFHQRFSQGIFPFKLSHSRFYHSTDSQAIFYFLIKKNSFLDVTFGFQISIASREKDPHRCVSVYWKLFAINVAPFFLVGNFLQHSVQNKLLYFNLANETGFVANVSLFIKSDYFISLFDCWFCP